MRRLDSEYVDLDENPDPRFYVARRLGHRNPEWECVLLMDSFTSAYRDAIITIKLIFPIEWPLKPPSVEFLTAVFHPFVHKRFLRANIFKRLWWAPRTRAHMPNSRNGASGKSAGEKSAPISMYPFQYGGARFCLETIYNLFEYEGRVPGLLESNQDSKIREIIEREYMLFDKIVQRCLGQELSEDIRVHDSPSSGWADIGEWADECSTQRKLNIIQMRLLEDAFGGRFPEIQAITRKFLGIEEGGIDKRNIFLSTYTFDAVYPSEGRVVFQTKDGVRVTSPKWSFFDLLTDVDSEDIVPIPYDSSNLHRVLELCESREETTMRVYNPTVEGLEPIDTPESTDQILSILDMANFLGANRLVMRCCFTLNKLIKKRSRVLVLDKHSSGQFRTFVSL